MIRCSNRFGIILAAATSLFFAGLSGAIAEQQSIVASQAASIGCSEMAFEVAYQTPPRFISWLLERSELIAQIAAAERRAAPTVLKAAMFVNGEVNRRQTVERVGLAGGGGE